MKNWILAALFIVSWNEYELKPTIGSQGWPGEPYTVETTTHTIKLATQKDVDLFLGDNDYVLVPKDPIYSSIGHWEKRNHGIIGENALNISVKEIK